MRRSLASLLFCCGIALAGEEEMKSGEFWYRMQDPAGKPTGFARLEIEQGEQQGLRVAWELRIVHQGTPYEEERTMALDAEGRLIEASYATAGSSVSARREGDRMKGTATNGKSAPIDVEVSDDAVTGMGFVLAAALPFEKGATVERNDCNEAQGFKAEGKAVFAYEVLERITLPGGEVDVHKVLMRRAKGGELPIWIGADRVIAQVDWGGGNLMVLSPEPTRDLFKPPTPAFVDVESEDASRLVLTGEFARFSPEELFEHWTTPELLTKFWPQKAEIEPEVGGKFHAVWEQPAWFMRGTITAFEKPVRLTFTWKWDHMPDKPELEVELTFEAIEGGTRVRIVQGPYRATDEDRAERKGHRDGWLWVGGRLRALRE